MYYKSTAQKCMPLSNAWATLFYGAIAFTQSIRCTHIMRTERVFVSFSAFVALLLLLLLLQFGFWVTYCMYTHFLRFFFLSSVV